MQNEYTLPKTWRASERGSEADNNNLQCSVIFDLRL